MNRIKHKQRRMQLLSEVGFPTQSEVRCQLGGPLAEVFFESLDDKCKEDLGLIPPLKGVISNELWMSPSDILIGKVLMKMPMPTRRVIRALTHQGILEIGDNCLHKLEKKYAMDKQQCLIELQMDMAATAKEERDKAVERATAELQDKHNKEIENLLEQFKEDVSSAVTETKLCMERETAVLVQQEREEVHNLMQDQMEDSMLTLEEKLANEFKWRLNETVRGLGLYYGQHIGDQIAHFNWRLQMAAVEQANFELRLHCQMEAQTSSDVAYAVCRERLRCQQEKDDMRHEFQEQTALLQQTIQAQIAQLQASNTASAAMDARFDKWLEKVRELVKEFQKFINYALKAVPGQAQFLLLVEKLLTKEINRPASQAGITNIDPEKSVDQCEEEPSSETDSSGEKKSVTSMESDTSVLSETTLLSDSVLTATQPVADVLDALVIQATPLNTEEEEIIGCVLETLVKKSTPDPETDEIVNAITEELLCEVVSLDVLMIDVSTQIPDFSKPVEDTTDIICYASSPIMSPSQEENLWESAECAWCEITDEQGLPICDHEPMTSDTTLLTPDNESAESLPALQTEIEQPNFQERGYVGEGGNEHEQPDGEFVHDRVEALLKIFHKHPSLTQIFIS